MKRVNNISLKVKTKPTITPVTLEELKKAAEIPLDNKKLDDELEDLIETAVEDVQRIARTTLINTTYTQTMDSFSDTVYSVYDFMYYYSNNYPSYISNYRHNYFIKLLAHPVTSITEVRVVDLDNNSTVWDSSNYFLAEEDRLAISQNASFPSNLRAVAAIEIDFVAGQGAEVGDVDSIFKTSIKQFAISNHDATRSTREPRITPEKILQTTNSLVGKRKFYL
jgi:hypothetical protein